MSVVYIAGPMSGIEDFNRPAFHEMAQALRAEGHTVLNPAELPDGLTEAQYMQIGLAMLHCADVIYLLQDWLHSSGARAEKALAEKLGLEMYFQVVYPPRSCIPGFMRQANHSSGGNDD
ncbi:Uncharacterised protein [Edwardsiella tarda]|nr:Uncharacterised protein [Edwardsiella tarda]